MRLHITLGALLATAGALGVWACSSDQFTSADAGSDRDADVDAQATDADVGAPLDAGPQNLLSNADFESGCLSWIAVNAQATTETTIRHSGTKACRVCKIGPGLTTLSQVVPGTLPPNTKYVFSAWIYVVDGDAGLAPYAGPSTLNPYVSASGSAVNLPGQWIESGAVLTTAADGGSDLTGKVATTVSSPSGCFIVDDAVLSRSP